MDMQLDLDSMMNSMNETMTREDAFKTKPVNNYSDERVFKISKDSEGNGEVVIRFLPVLNDEKTDLVSFKTKRFHSINNQRIVGDKVEKRWTGEFICPSQHGDGCPICSYGWDNYKAHKETLGKDDKQTKSFLKFTAKEKYLSNILVIKDDINPSNNGKIFVLEFGSQLLKLIQKEMQPDDSAIKHKGAEMFNGWDLKKGKNFVLKLTDKKFTDNGFPSWENSFFVKDRSAVVSSNEEFAEMIQSVHDLNDFIKPELVPEEKVLLEKLDDVLFKTSKKEDNKPNVQKEMPTTQTYTPPVAQSAESPKEEHEPVQEVTQEVAQEPVQETVTQEPVQEEPKEPASGAVNMDDFLNQFKK